MQTATAMSCRLSCHLTTPRRSPRRSSMPLWCLEAGSWHARRAACGGAGWAPARWWRSHSLPSASPLRRRRCPRSARRTRVRRLGRLGRVLAARTRGLVRGAAAGTRRGVRVSRHVAASSRRVDPAPVDRDRGHESRVRGRARARARTIVGDLGLRRRRRVCHDPCRRARGSDRASRGQQRDAAPARRRDRSRVAAGSVSSTPTSRGRMR